MREIFKRCRLTSCASIGRGWRGSCRAGRDRAGTPGQMRTRGSRGRGGGTDPRLNRGTLGQKGSPIHGGQPSSEGGDCTGNGQTSRFTGWGHVGGVQINLAKYRNG